MLRRLCISLMIILIVLSIFNASAYDNRKGNAAFKAYIEELCSEYGVPPTLIYAIIEKESNWNTGAVNFDGTCFGLMQINIVNADVLKRVLGLNDLTNPYQNIKAGIYMISGYIEEYIDYQMALMCYNCGEGGAKKLWNSGYFSTAYSRWIIDRMDQLDWELLDAARQKSYDS